MEQDVAAGEEQRAGHGPWTEPGAHPVAPGVHRIPLPLPGDALTAVNVYALEEADGLTLVDAGWATPEAMTALRAGLGLLGRDVGDVRRILVTHIHRDHYTQAVALRRRTGARVLLGEGERRGLELIHDARGVPASSLDALDRAGARELADGIRDRMRGFRWDAANWEAPDAWLTAGTVEVGGRTLRVLPTPGHTRGHVVFLDEDARLLFGGDHVLPHITPSIGLELADPGAEPLADYLDSLRLVSRYPDARLLPAHGPVTDSAHTRVIELVDHHERRLAQTLAAVVAGAATGAEAAARLPWTRRERAFAELDPFNRMLAITETVAHLDVLIQRGQLARKDEDGVTTYALVPPVG